MEGVFRQPNPLRLDGNLSENWKLFEQVFDNYLVATGLSEKSNKVKCAILLQCIGEDCVPIYNAFTYTDSEDRHDIDTLKSKFRQHCQPRKNVTYDRHIFLTTKQAAGESFDSFVTDLKNKAKQCEYGELKDSFIRDQIIAGVQNNALRLRMLRESDLTLERAIDLCRATEFSEAQIKSLNPSGTAQQAAEVNAVQHSRHKPSYRHKRHTSQHKQCGNCGQSHAKRKCPAFGTTCSYCHKLNHFDSICRQRQRDSYQKSKKKLHYSKRNRPVHTLTQDTDTHSESDDSDNVQTFSEMYIGSVEKSTSRSSKDWTVTVTCNGKPLDLKIDTGAQTNVLNVTHYRQLTNKPLEKCTDRLVSYSGHRIETLGQCSLNIKYSDHSYSVKFVVADTNSSSIIGLQSSVQLNLIKKLCSVNETHESDNVNFDILSEYNDLFTGLGKLPVQYKIEVDPNITPVISPPRKVPLALKTRVKAELDRMEKAGVVEKVQGHTPWVSNMVTVVKPNKIRICLDPQNLNKAIKREHHPMYTVEEVVSNMPKAKYFSKLDATSGFWQIPLDEESSRLCTFSTPFGRYKYLRLAFGINSAPEIFQSVMQQLFSDLEGVEVVMDDLLIWGETPQQHDKRLKAVLDRCRENNMKLKREKCKIGLTEIQYVGHTLSSAGLKADPEKIKAVDQLPTPTDKASLQRFLGMMTYVAKFIPNFSTVSAPLRELLTKETEWYWDTPQQNSFNELKRLATTAPVLKYYDVNEATTLSVDASSHGLGATVLQNNQPVAYASKAMTKSQQRYAQIEKEMLAILFGCQRFHQYIYGKTITVETDHKPLVSIFKKPLLQAPARLQSMLLKLQRYDLRVIHKPGKDLLIADALSRAHMTDEYTEVEAELEICMVIPASPVKLQQIENETNSDQTLQILKTTILTGWPASQSEVPAEIQTYWNHRDELSVYGGIIFKSQKIVIPTSLRGEMIDTVHASHLGMTLCKQRARDIIFWPGMGRDIENAVSKCKVCNEMQYNNSKEPLMSHPPPTRPWSKLGSDLFEIKGDYYLIVADYYSGFFELSQLRDTTSKTVISHTKSHFARHGIPDVLVTDNGPQYSSADFKKFSTEYGFQHVTSSPHHPRANGMSEKCVQIAKRLLIKSKKDGTDPNLALLAHRNTPRNNMGSPAQRLFSRRLKTQLPVAEKLLNPQVITNVDRHLQKAKEVQKQYYDRQARPLQNLEPGDIVRYKGNTKEWKPGTVENTCTAPRSYNIKTPDGTILRRNRVHLRRTKEKAPSPEPTPIELLPEPTTPPIKTTPRKLTINRPSQSVDSTPQQPVTLTTRGRPVKIPSRFQDYAM